MVARATDAGTPDGAGEDGVAGGTNQFEGGTVRLFRAGEITPIGEFSVAGNTTGANATVTLTVDVPADAATFQDLCDDDVAGGITAAKMAPVFSEMGSRYEPACVTVNATRTDLAPGNANSVNSNQVAFCNNIGFVGWPTVAPALRAMVTANKQGRSTNGFWLTYVLGAFQQSSVVDNDPNSEGAVMGSSSGSSLAQQDSEAGCILYRETMRDFIAMGNPNVRISEDNLWKIEPVHEVGHEFGMNDGNYGPGGQKYDGTAMDAGTFLAWVGDLGEIRFEILANVVYGHFVSASFRAASIRRRFPVRPRSARRR